MIMSRQDIERLKKEAMAKEDRYMLEILKEEEEKLEQVEQTKKALKKAWKKAEDEYREFIFVYELRDEELEERVHHSRYVKFLEKENETLSEEVFLRLNDELLDDIKGFNKFSNRIKRYWKYIFKNREDIAF